MSEKACIVYHDMITTYGHGLHCCMDALFADKTNFNAITRFEYNADAAAVAACFPEDIFPEDTVCLAEESLMLLFNSMPEDKSLSSNKIPIFFALTQGEISMLNNPEKKWTARLAAEKTAGYFQTDFKIFSASCASGNIALARAAAEIESGRQQQILIAGCDVVSEFTHAGFSSVHAVTPDLCRPYDASHNGLLLGDAAGIILLASESLAKKNNWQILAAIEGYAITTDSYHAAAPDPQGRQMASAIEKIIRQYPQNNIAGVIGHGTGTVLNDNMEIAALTKVFPNGIPLASVKGGTGHILAASGLIQTSCAVACLERGQLFPQTSLQHPQDGAEKFVSNKIQQLNGDTVLTLNAGFGGLNAVIAVRRCQDEK